MLRIRNHGSHSGSKKKADILAPRVLMAWRFQLPGERASIRDMTMTPLSWKKRLACGHCEVLMPLAEKE